MALHDTEIEEYLEPDWFVSEDYLDHSDLENDLIEIYDVSNEELNLNNLPVQIPLANGSTHVIPQDNTDMQNYIPQLPPIQVNTSITQSTTPTFPVRTRNKRVPPASRPAKLKKIKWKKGNLVTNSLLPHTEGLLSNNVLELYSPLDYFLYFFNDKIMEKIKFETELYSVQKTPNKPISISINELKRFLGICIYASVLHTPKIRDYWSTELGFPPIFEAMSRNRYEAIRSVLHFNDNSNMLLTNANHDRLHKIRPLVDHLNERFSSIPHRRSLLLDEQLCATKARSYMKQYLPDKPHKWGYKLFILSDYKGYCYSFEIYTGQENEERFHFLGEPDIGASGNVVVRLTRNVPNTQNFKLYFDNYYSSIPLIQYLHSKNIHSVGTVRLARLPNCSLSEKNLEKKMKRGDSKEYITSYDGTLISVTMWKDNKSVKLISSYCGEIPKTQVQRFCRSSKNSITVPCPFIVTEYNKHMGGVDLLDSLIGRYKIKMRSRKWYLRLFYHLLDMTVVNSWLLYKRVQEQQNKKATYELANWRIELAYILTKLGKVNQQRDRRSTSIETKISSTRPKSFHPPKCVRTDNTSHWQLYTSKRARCKFPKCSGFSYRHCSKCKIYLCYTITKNCFINYHQS